MPLFKPSLVKNYLRDEKILQKLYTVQVLRLSQQDTVLIGLDIQRDLVHLTARPTSGLDGHFQVRFWLSRMVLRVGKSKKKNKTQD